MPLFETQKVQNLNFKSTVDTLDSIRTFLMHQKANFWLAHRTKLKFCWEVDFVEMVHMSRKNCCWCHFYIDFFLWFFNISQLDAPIKLKWKKYFFSSFNRLCQVPAAYLLHGSILKYDIQYMDCFWFPSKQASFRNKREIHKTKMLS